MQRFRLLFGYTTKLLFAFFILLSLALSSRKTFNGLGELWELLLLLCASCLAIHAIDYVCGIIKAMITVNEHMKNHERKRAKPRNPNSRDGRFD